MENIKFDNKGVLSCISQDNIDALGVEGQQAVKTLIEGTGAGNDFLGWVRLPQETPASLLDSINATASRLRDLCDVVVAVGIGGSYLGAKAVIEALSNTFAAYEPAKTRVLFAGQNIGEDYMAELQEYLRNRKFGIIVISKSGTTTEPAIAFRLLKEQLEAQVGREEACKRIVAITDEKRGALRTLATAEGYETYIIPDNVGGRFSVLTPVGLLPIAVAGFDIHALVKGAADMAKATISGTDTLSLEYAKTRNALYRAGKKIEILVNFNPKLHFFSEWWKQLYGESEGKDGKGIYPASVDDTTDLHSMGQWIQEGERIIFETVISVEKSEHTLTIPFDESNLDGLNYIAGKRIDEVNKMAELGTRIAHIDGGVPNIKISIPEISAYNLGSLIYFFEAAVGISGYLLGVEAYKRNMFALLEKPGYEKETEAIRAKL